MEKKPIIEKCVGCKKVTEDGFCKVYTNPEAKWSIGGCFIATHISKEKSFMAKMMNPLKASKKMKRKK